MVNPDLLLKTNKTHDFKVVFFALYLSCVWVTSGFFIPLSVFNNVPLYVFFTFVIFLMLNKDVVKEIVLLFMFLITYEFLKCLQSNFIFTVKGVMGLFAFSFIMPVTKEAFLGLKNCSDEWLGKWLRILLWCIFLSVAIEQLLDLVGIPVSPGFTQRNYFFGTKSLSGFFEEPSHIALGLSPYIFMLVYNYELYKKHMGSAGIFLIVGLFVLCPSSTLFMILGLSFFIVVIKQIFSGNIKVALLAFSALAIFFASILAVPQFSERFRGVFTGAIAQSVVDSQYSVLAFIKGFQMTSYAIGHFPLGVAFLNMEILAPQSIISYFSDYTYELNSADGASLLFKGICEMGILFFIFVIISMYGFVKEIKERNVGGMYNLVFLAFYFSFYAHFVRGASYYYGVTAISISLIIYSICNRAFLIQIIRLRTR